MMVTRRKVTLPKKKNWKQNNLCVGVVNRKKKRKAFDRPRRKKIARESDQGTIVGNHEARF